MLSNASDSKMSATGFALTFATSKPLVTLTRNVFELVDIQV